MKGKATKYGSMDRPCIVAVNVPTFPLEDLDIMAAFFGDGKTAQGSEEGCFQKRLLGLGRCPQE
jgi:hypothetical protein